MRPTNLSAFALPLLLACGAKSEAPPAAPPAAKPEAPAPPPVTSPAPATPEASTKDVAPAAAVDAAATAAVPPATCTHPGLVQGSAQARPIGSIRELATALGKTAESDEEAVTALCQGRSPAVCNATMVAYVVAEDDGQGGGDLSVYFRTGQGGDGPWAALSRIVPSDPQDDSEVVQAPSAFDEGRYLQIVVAHSERVFGSQCDPEGGCELDSEAFGAVAVDLVIDRKLGRHAWTSINSAWGAETCDAHLAPSVVEGAFVRSDCAGKPDRFTATDLAQCTAEVHAAWVKDQAARYEAEKAKAEKVLAARSTGGAAPGEPKAGATGARSAAEHLAEGRRLTREKKFDEAIAAFSAASDADPELLEALSGRCYARLLRNRGDDLKDALDDCDSVRTSIKGSSYEGNGRFFGAVCFNVGLIHEKLGQKSEALDAFELSLLHAPGDAARKKVAALKGP